VLIGGGFTQVDNIARRRVARIFANGLVDTGFVPPPDLAGVVYAALAQADGRVSSRATLPAWRAPRDKASRA